MTGHRFKAFLRSRQWNDNQSKWFVDQAVTDPGLPDPDSWDELREYLEGRSAHERTIDEARYIWDLYASRGAETGDGGAEGD